MDSKNILVRGVVSDEKGNPVSNASVGFSKSPVPLPDIAILTNEDGKFVLSVPSEGDYELTFNAGGYDLEVIDFKAESGKEINLNITLK